MDTLSTVVMPTIVEFRLGDFTAPTRCKKTHRSPDRFFQEEGGEWVVCLVPYWWCPVGCAWRRKWRNAPSPAHNRHDHNAPTACEHVLCWSPPRPRPLTSVLDDPDSPALPVSARSGRGRPQTN